MSSRRKGFGVKCAVCNEERLHFPCYRDIEKVIVIQGKHHHIIQMFYFLIALIFLSVSA